VINEKIEYAASVLASLGGTIDDSDTVSKAAAASDGGESLRALMLAIISRKGVRDCLSLCFRSLRQAIDGSDGSVERSILEAIRDKDILSSSLIAQNPVLLGEVSSCLRYPQLLELIDEVWAPTYDRADAEMLWKINFRSSDRKTAQRLAKLADVTLVDLPSMIGHIESIEALEVFVDGMTPQAVAASIPAIYAQIEQDSIWGNAEEDGVLLVLLSKQIKRDPQLAEFANKYFDEIVLRRRDFRDLVAAASMHFAELAKALGRLDDPVFFKKMAKSGLNEISVENLNYLLDSGMPPTLFVPETKDGDACFIHLLDSADFDQMEVLASRMTKEQRDDFSRYKLPWLSGLNQLSNYSGGTAFDGSCLDRNALTVLHECGIDLGFRYPDGNGGVHYLHEVGNFRDRFRSGQVFTMLHALGVCPRDLQLRNMGPIHVAAEANDAQAIRRLVELGYDIDEHSKSCDSPLIIAAKLASNFAFEELLRLGADTGIKARTGASLMQLVRDDDLKRLVKSARTSASIGRAMSSGGSAPEQRSSASDPSIL
jgi:hypothetical protein